MSDVINGVPSELLERVEEYFAAKGIPYGAKLRTELRALLTAQPQASAAQSAPIEDRGWPDRDYWCKCCECGEMFTGHKRQLVCRVCTEERAAQSAPAGEREAFEAELCAKHGYRPLTLKDLREGDTYFGSSLPLAWDSFQAGAAWQRTQSAQVPNAPLPHWEPCNPGCDPEFNGSRSRHCAKLCHNAREALAAAPAQPAAQDQGEVKP